MPHRRGKARVMKWESVLKWDYFVDIATAVWLALFLLRYTNQVPAPDLILQTMLAIFVADLVVKYRREGNLKSFLRHRWIDILLVIPWFRAFRFLKFIRMLRLLRTALQLERLRRKSRRLFGEIRQVVLRKSPKSS